MICKRAFRSWSSSVPLQRVRKRFYKKTEAGISCIQTDHGLILRCIRTLHSVRAEFRPDQLLDGSLQGGAILA